METVGFVDLDSLLKEYDRGNYFYDVLKKHTPEEELVHWLHLAREGVKDGDIEEDICFVRGCMKKVTLACLQKQSLEKELAELLFEGYKKAAEKWLRLVKERSKNERVDAIICYIYDFLEKAKNATENKTEKDELEPNVWLAKRNESDETIRQYRLRGHTREAEKLLARARSGVHLGSVEFLIDMIWDNLKKGGMVPEDIKTSKSELNSLKLRGNDLQRRMDRNRAKGKKYKKKSSYL